MNKTFTEDPLKSPQVFLVEASAGAGKTHALARRYVELLLTSSAGFDEFPLKHILAITFTNKAAFEMRKRIIDFLKQIAFDEFPNKALKEDMYRALSLSEEVARGKASAMMDFLLRNFTFFQVETIDSFINGVLKASAFALGFSGGFRLKTDNRDFIEYSLDCFLDQVLSDDYAKSIITNFLKNYLVTENKQGWLPRENMIGLVKDLDSTSTTYRGVIRKGPISIEKLLERKKKFVEKIKAFEAMIPSGVYKRFHSAVITFLENCRDSFSVKNLPAVFANSEIPVKKGFEISPDLVSSWEKICAEITDLVTSESQAFFNCYVEMFSLVRSFYCDLVKKEDVIFLNELNAKAADLFGNTDSSVPELYYRLATRFYDYLMDEFQDTSSMQWQNLVPMVEETLASGGSFFCVGDRKQALYRFRGGDPTLLHAVQRSYDAYGVKPVYLTTNYRSAPQIITFNNTVFSEQNLDVFCRNEYLDAVLSQEDIAEIKEVFLHAHQDPMHHSGQGNVIVSVIEDEKSDLAEEHIKEKTLQSIRTSYRSSSDIAVLVRKNDDVEKITSWLMAEGIPVESERTLCIRENSAITEIVSLLLFLNSPIDNASFASFILGNVFLTATGLDRDCIQEFIFDSNRHSKNKEAVYLYRKFREKYPGLWENYIKEYFNKVGIYPLYELVVDIYKTYSVCDNIPENQIFFMRFLEVIAEQEKECPDISSFLDFFCNPHDPRIDYVFMNTHQKDSVRVMTFHKAKGLEFDTVILPYFAPEIKVNNRITCFSEDSLHLVYLHKNYVKFSPFLQKLYAQEYKKSLLDELNAAYVALTRARNTLYVFIPEKTGRTKNIFTKLIRVNMSDQRQITPTGTVDKKQAEHSSLKIPPSEYADWFDMLQNEFRDEREISNRKRIIEGEILHEILAQIGNLQNCISSSVLTDASERIKRKYPACAAFDDYTSRIDQLIHCENVSRFFFLSNKDVFCEKEVVTKEGHFKKIDRLIVSEKEVWVVDYKSSRDFSEKQHEQVKEYLEIIRDIYPGRTVKGYLVYFDDFGVEEVQK